jgi:hypothetical protein
MQMSLGIGREGKIVSQFRLRGDFQYKNENQFGRSMMAL